MPLQPGTQLGHYEILEMIGKGGMGEVYRARDPRLGRDVAIKVSAAQFNERFDREARAVAALNHPNICTLHDVGPNYLVMEFVEGEAPRGPLPIDEALRISRQIAAALEAAHEKGIVHRDLKPGNIKIKPDGSVKVLDFGLAKVTGAAAVPSEDSPTLSMAATQAGVVLGTAAYMAPEQARGKPVDKRADIWAFGVVLHEMLTGERLFKGEDLTEILAGVVKDHPDLSRVPAQVRPLLERCLEKDPRKRLRDIGDMELLLRPAASESVKPQERGIPALLMKTVPWAVAAAAVAWMYLRTPPAEPQPTTRFLLPAITVPNINPMFRISPNGRILAYTDRAGRSMQIFVRPFDSVEARAVPGTDNVAEFFWSPDSTALGFFADGKVKRVGLSGEPPQTLANSETSRGGAWSKEGVILFAPGPTESIFRIPETGSTTPERVTPKPGPGEGYRYPQFLPDGKHFLLFRAADDPKLNGVYVTSIDGMTPEKLLPDGTNVAYAGGQLFFRREGALMTQTFDATNLRLTGGASPVVEGIRDGANNIFWGAFDAAQGVLAYQLGGRRSESISCVWVDRAGNRTNIIDSTAGGGKLSPDARFLAYKHADPRSTSVDPDIWIRNIAQGTNFRLTSQGSYSYTWSPDGSEIAYAQRTPVTSTLYRIGTSGAAKPVLVGPLGSNAQLESWSPDGKTIAYTSNQINGANSDIMLVSLDGDHKPVPYLETPYPERDARFSPDGHWMAYASSESGRLEVYVQAVPATAARFPISSGGGSRPHWKADGKELYFQTVDRRIMTVPVKTGSTFEYGAPRTVLEKIGGDYQPTFDGQRFLVNVQGDDATVAPPITVVLNWRLGGKK